MQNTKTFLYNTTIKIERTMKVTDLMIGDWVEVVQNGEKHFAQVRMIDGYGDNATANECICDAIYYSINEIEPIPLTPEILEKNGFELYEQDFTSHKVYKFGSLDYIEVDEWYMGVGGYVEYKHFNTTHRFIHYVFKLYYVHELQHALKLCGIEKEIVL